MCLKYTSLINIKQRGWDDKKFRQPSGKKVDFVVCDEKTVFKDCENMQFRSVRVLGVQMRIMMEADNLCCNFDRISFKTNLS